MKKKENNKIKNDEYNKKCCFSKQNLTNCCNCLKNMVECLLTCLDNFDYENKYNLEISSICNIIQNIIYLFLFLLIFVDYSDFSFKKKISSVLLYITIFITGIVFLIRNIIQGSKENDSYDCDCCGYFSILVLTFCKAIFLFGIWTIFENNVIFKKVNLLYLSYFILSFLYYFTLTIFLITKKAFNFFWFLIFGFIFVGLATLIIYLITENNEITIYGLIIFILEIVFYNFGLGIAICRGVLNGKEIIWKVLHIEIYRLYPLLILCSIPAILIVIIIGGILCCCGCRI